MPPRAHPAPAACAHAHVFCPSDPPDCDKGPGEAAFATRTMPAHGDGHGQDTTRLGTTERYADTLGVNPGKRDDVIVSADRPGMWRFHCHILRHIEGIEGMFGMVNTPIVTPTKVDLTPLLT